MKLFVAPRPCNTCPYRRDTPAGIWHPSEYAKLATYDENPGTINTFHCHQERVTRTATACRGWLGVHAEGVAVRVALALGSIEPGDVPIEEDPSLFASGTEAMEAGMAGVSDPSKQARVVIEKFLRNGFEDDTSEIEPGERRC